MIDKPRNRFNQAVFITLIVIGIMLFGSDFSFNAMDIMGIIFYLTGFILWVNQDNITKWQQYK